MEPRPLPVQRPVLALVFRLGSALSFATMMMLIKLLSERHVSLPEIMFFRQATCVPLLLLGLAATGQLGSLRTTRIRAHGARGVVGMTNMVFNFGATILLPLAESTTLGFTTALFAVLIAGLILKEQVGPWRWTAVLLGFAGVVIVAQPGGEPVNPLGVGAAMVCALLTAVINYQIRDLGRTEPPTRVVFWFSVIGSVLATPFMAIWVQPHDPATWAMLVAMGACGLFGQLGMTAALRLGSVTSVIVMDYTTLIWATLYGWLIWDRLPPTTLWLGAPLIVAAGAIIAWRQHRLSKEIATMPAEVD